MFPSSKQSLSTLSELRCCFPHVRRGNMILCQPFYPVTKAPQVWVTDELCDRSDADELSRCFKGLSLSRSLSVCGHWNAERNNMKGKWSLQAVVSYSLQFPCFWYSQHWGFGVHQQRMSAGQFKMHRTDHPDCEWLEGRAIWVQPQARLDGSLWQDFL